MGREMKTVTFDEAKWKLVPVEPTDEMVEAGQVGAKTKAGFVVTRGRIRAAIQTAPAHPDAWEAPKGWDAQFLAARLSRVAAFAGVAMPDDMSDEEIAEVAGTVLGQIAYALESKAGESRAKIEARALDFAAGICSAVGNFGDGFRCAEELRTMADKKRQLAAEKRAGNNEMENVR